MKTSFLVSAGPSPSASSRQSSGGRGEDSGVAGRKSAWRRRSRRRMEGQPPRRQRHAQPHTTPLHPQTFPASSHSAGLGRHLFPRLRRLLKYATLPIGRPGPPCCSIRDTWAYRGIGQGNQLKKKNSSRVTDVHLRRGSDSRESAISPPGELLTMANCRARVRRPRKGGWHDLGFVLGPPGSLARRF